MYFTKCVWDSRFVELSHFKKKCLPSADCLTQSTGSEYDFL